MSKPMLVRLSVTELWRLTLRIIVQFPGIAGSSGLSPIPMTLDARSSA
jgi:hypothetical protein